MKLYAARSQLPATASVSYTPPAGGEPWVFNVVLEVGNASRRSAAIELTSSNLKRLRGFLSLEIAGLAPAAATRPPASAPSRKARRARPPEQKPDTPAGRAPRGAPGEREYFDRGKNRWVRKLLKKGGKDPVRRYRILLRHPTEPEMPAAVAVPECKESAPGGGEEAGFEQDAAATLGL